MISQHEPDHRFHDGHGAGDDAGIVASAGGQLRVFAGGGDRLLGAGNGGCRFESHPESDVFAIADPALYPARPVGHRAGASLAHFKGVVVLESGQFASLETRADFKSFGRRQAKHGFGQIGLQFVEDRIAEARRALANQAFDEPADRIALRSRFFDPRDHLFRRNGIRTTDRIGLDGFGGDAGGIDLRFDLMHPADPRQHLDAGMERVENLAGHHTGGNPPDGFPGRGASPALPIADTVFGLIGEIGVRRTEGRLHFAVSLGTRVLVADENGDRGAQGFALENAGQNFAAVGFFARGDDVALPRAPAIEFFLDVGFGQFQLRQAAIDDHPDPAAVGFPPRGDTEKLAGAAGHKKSLTKRQGHG